MGLLDNDIPGLVRAAIVAVSCLGLGACLTSSRPLITNPKQLAHPLPDSAVYESFSRSDGVLKAFGTSELSYDAPRQTYRFKIPNGLEEGPGFGTYDFVMTELAPTLFIAQTENAVDDTAEYFLVAINQGIVLVYDFGDVCDDYFGGSIPDFPDIPGIDRGACTASSLAAVKEFLLTAYQRYPKPYYAFFQL